MRIGARGAAAVVEKTAGIACAATAPNVTITWASGELDIDPGVYTWQLTATDDGADRIYEGTFQVLDVIA